MFGPDVPSMPKQAIRNERKLFKRCMGGGPSTMSQKFNLKRLVQTQPGRSFHLHSPPEEKRIHQE
jgi:hypothetical protein